MNHIVHLLYKTEQIDEEGKSYVVWEESMLLHGISCLLLMEKGFKFWDCVLTSEEMVGHQSGIDFSAVLGSFKC